LPDVVCMGEVLVQFNAMTRGPLRNVQLFEKHAAGAEGNVAIGAARLGCNDEFGRFIIGTLRAERVDTLHITVDYDSPTAAFFIQRGHPIPNKSEAFYYRKGSAGSKLCPDDVDPAYLASSKIFHVTGITPALSQSAMDATVKATKAAKEAHVTISLDTNIRLKLWPPEVAGSNLLPL